jgi:hypothetical protein
MSTKTQAGIVTESVAFKLLCDMQDLRGKVDLTCNIGAALAQRWEEEVLKESCHNNTKRANPSRLRDEMEELVLELVDTSMDIQKMKERKELACRFFALAERRPAWCYIFCNTFNNNNNDDNEYKYDSARALLQLIDLEECHQVVDKLTTVLLGYLTAGEREEEEMALRRRCSEELDQQALGGIRLPLISRDRLIRSHVDLPR